MNIIVVINSDWHLDIPGIAVVQAKDYLSDPAFGSLRSLRVFNLCQTYRYQSIGYYVSLIAEARGHKPVPRIGAIKDLQSQHLVRHLTEGLDELIQKSLSSIEKDRLGLDIYFGRNMEGSFDELSMQLFKLLHAPWLRANFVRRDHHWSIRNVHATGDIIAADHEFAARVAGEYFIGHGMRVQKLPRYNLAILHDPKNPEPASNPRAMQKFEKAAGALGMAVKFITRADIGKLSGFDALFIRDTTFANHYTYRISRLAEAKGLVVIDDSDSILKCNNKVYLAEILARHRIPAPKTLLVGRDNVGQIIPRLSLPCVLKKPDSSFSMGVVKVESEKDLHDKVRALLGKSDLIIAQEYLPTDFDWRIGIIDQKLLFVVKYFMAPGHWQIIKRDEQNHGFIEGKTLAVNDAPKRVVKLALKAANLIGAGFYGVDIKQIGKRYCVIEINDNPSVDAGNEDGVLKDALYREVMGVFLKRIEMRRAAR